ncbi:sugar phosphate nucleotidyltransferase [Blattabacterium cuenoti]|uniref:sugar phosphate nucleotidyltransferase n=1 Tax=Blattabacterium cuenoti TaxID=1653831 RepID=UPI00163BFADB|nr:sugar phosphate nucleotidyltransferase [Blattabacterium cuenoti]
MKIIIPMAGEGTRLRPHTLNTPKPLISIVGKSILKRLIDNLSFFLENFLIEEIIYIISYKEKEIEEKLRNISNEIGIPSIVYFQKKPLGTADALLQAKNSLIGPIIISFSDTLFYHKKFNSVDKKFDNIIWTKKVKDPNLFGIVQCSLSGYITNFIEKPKNNISNLAIIGLYYFKDASILKNELQYYFLKKEDKNKKNGKEYQLTSVLENMRKKGIKFFSQEIHEWMDFGNKKKIVSSNSKILALEYKKFKLIHKESVLKNSLIIHPCYIGKNSTIENSIIGPYVSIGNFSKIENSNINRSIIQNNSRIRHASFSNSIIGNYTSYIGISKEVDLGDYSMIKEIL